MRFKSDILSTEDAGRMLRKSKPTIIKLIDRYRKHAAGDAGEESWLYGWKEGRVYRTTYQAVCAYARGIYNFEPYG